MNLNEIFDTENKVIWKDTVQGCVGSFSIDDELYLIDVEDYEIKLETGVKSIIDVGFRKGKSSELTGDQRPGRVIGSVVNALKEKVKQLTPDIIMFGALNKNGEVEKRKVLYRKIASLLSKTTKYNHLSDWYKFKDGEYAFIASFNPTESDTKLVQSIITNK